MVPSIGLQWLVTLGDRIRDIRYHTHELPDIHFCHTKSAVWIILNLMKIGLLWNYLSEMMIEYLILHGVWKLPKILFLVPLLVSSTLSPMITKLNYFSHKVINISCKDQSFLPLMKLRQIKIIFDLSTYFPYLVLLYRMFWSLTWIKKSFIKCGVDWTFGLAGDLINYARLIETIWQICACHHRWHRTINSKTSKYGFQQASWSTYKYSNTLKVLSCLWWIY